MPKKKLEKGEPLPLDPKAVVLRWNEIQLQIKLLEKEEKQLKLDLFKIVGDEDDFVVDLDIPYNLHKVVRDISSTDYNELKEKAIIAGVDLMKLPIGCAEVNVTLTPFGAQYLVGKGLSKEDLAAAHKVKFAEHITVKPKED